MLSRLGLRTLILSFAIACSGAAAQADSLSFNLTLPGGGNIAGLPGSTIGWGYSITNNSASDWLETTNLNAGTFLNLNPGTSPNPNVLFDFPIVAPLGTATDNYLAVTAGLFEIAWSSSAPLGFANSGTFTVSGEFFSDNPLNPLAVDLGSAPDATANYSATVGTNPVPEPTSFSLLLTGLVAGFLMGKKRFHFT